MEPDRNAADIAAVYGREKVKEWKNGCDEAEVRGAEAFSIR